MRHLFGRVCVLFALVGGLLGCEDHYLLEERLPTGDDVTDLDLSWPDVSAGDDRDGDGVPDRADYRPDDPQWPGRAALGALYVHSFEALYSATSQDPGSVKRVDRFQVIKESGEFEPLYENVYDAAMDPYGVLYVITDQGSLLVCQPDTARCLQVAYEESCALVGGDFLPNALTWASLPDYPQGLLIAVSLSFGCYLAPVVEGGDLVGYRGSVETRLPVGYTVSGDITQMPDGLLVMSALDVDLKEVLLTAKPALGQTPWEVGGSLGEVRQMWGLAALESGVVGFSGEGAWWRLSGVDQGADALRVVSMGRVLLNDVFAGAAAPPLFFESPP